MLRIFKIKQELPQRLRCLGVC